MPIERVTLEKTGRVLMIGGDIEIDLAWPMPRIHSGAVSFANPDWATESVDGTSPLALRSPIHVRGSFARPEAKVDMAQMTAHAVGAIALGMLNPVLTLIPLIDSGPGSDSDCAQLVRDARALPK